MRAVAILTMLLATAGCNQEPSFDERYSAANKKITERAHEIDRELGTPSPSDQGRGSEELPERTE